MCIPQTNKTFYPLGTLQSATCAHPSEIYDGLPAQSDVPTSSASFKRCCWRKITGRSKYFFVFFFPPVLTYPLRLFSFLLPHRTEALSTLFRCLTSEHPGVRKVRLEGWRYFGAHSLMADAHVCDV